MDRSQYDRVTIPLLSVACSGSYYGRMSDSTARELASRKILEEAETYDRISRTISHRCG